MRRAPGVGGLLTEAALREHHRVLDAALETQDWTRAEALFEQAALLLLLLQQPLVSLLLPSNPSSHCCCRHQIAASTCSPCSLGAAIQRCGLCRGFAVCLRMLGKAVRGVQ